MSSSNGVDERAGQGDGVSLVDRPVGPRGDVEVRGLAQQGERCPSRRGSCPWAVRAAIVSSPEPADDRVLARAGVHRVARGRVAVRGERVEEQLVGPGLDRCGSPGVSVRRDLHVIRARARQGQVDDRRVLVLERVVIEGDDVAVRVVDRHRRVERALRPVQDPRHDLEVDQRAGLGGERVDSRSRLLPRASSPRSPMTSAAVTSKTRSALTPSRSVSGTTSGCERHRLGVAIVVVRGGLLVGTACRPRRRPA